METLENRDILTRRFKDNHITITLLLTFFDTPSALPALGLPSPQELSLPPHSEQ